MIFKKPYWYDNNSDNLISLDFNRELHPPGTYDEYPDGVVGIRMDDDFWACAALPWEYHNKPVEEIVYELWPELKNDPSVEFKPDSGDPWWTTYFKEIE